MKKLYVAILFAMVLIGAGLALSASQAKAGDFGFTYYVDNFGFWYGSGPSYVHRFGYWNGYNRSYNRGYRHGYNDSYRPFPYSYRPYPYWNKPYYYYNPRPYYYYAPRPYYRRWQCWP